MSRRFLFRSDSCSKKADAGDKPTLLRYTEVEPKAEGEELDGHPLEDQSASSSCKAVVSCSVGLIQRRRSEQFGSRYRPPFRL